MLVRSIGRAAAATLLSLAASAGLASVPSTALGGTQPVADPTVEQPFTATSGDACLYGQVKGVLGWRLPPVGGPPAAVDVSGVVLDKPTDPITTPECGDDRRFSVVTVSAYAGGSPIDTERVRADNSAQRFAFQLTNETRRAPIELVVVYVCRHSLATGQLDYCGARQVFRAPVSI
jgi:hypothetical protein